MKYTLITLAIASTLFAGGCIEAGAIAIDDARALHESAKGYVKDNHDLRRRVREECREILILEVDMLKALGEYDKARERLAANYPELVTIDIVKAALDDETAPLSEPFGCN